MRHILTLVAVAAMPVLVACGRAARLPDPGAGVGESPVAATRAWWRAFAVADTAQVRARSAPTLLLALSTGRTYDHAAALAQAATHTQGASMGMTWDEETVRLPAPDVAIVSSRNTETLGATSHTYRYLTTLERRNGAWQVIAAQSTREQAFARRVGPEVSGALAEYAGEYLTSRGAVLRVVVRDSVLGLVEPSGAELPMEPIGPALFEFGRTSPANGVVRFSFTRDASGRVTALNRLIPGYVHTFPRKAP